MKTEKTSKNERLAAKFASSFNLPVNKTVFLFLDWVSRERFPRIERSATICRMWMESHFVAYCQRTGTPRTWKNACEWYCVYEDDIKKETKRCIRA